MNHHDSEDDFLDALYKQSATEKPPVNIDQQILALAKETHQPKQFVKIMNFQRILSVAAVMVFAMYIFFDVDSKHSKFIDEELSYPQNSLPMSSSSPSSSEQQTEWYEMNEEAPLLKQRETKQAKKSTVKESAHFMADELSELSAQEASQNDLSARSAMPIKPEALKKELAKDTQRAENILKDIELLLESGKKVEATIAYTHFKAVFPDYPVPESLSEAFGNMPSP